MGQIFYPKPVKLIFSIISAREEMFIEAKNCLTNYFGKIDMESNYQAFDFTDYYQKEMGEYLNQKLVSFQELILAHRLSQIKNDSNQLELCLSREINQNDALYFPLPF